MVRKSRGNLKGTACAEVRLSEKVKQAGGHGRMCWELNLSLLSTVG